MTDIITSSLALGNAMPAIRVGGRGALPRNPWQAELIPMLRSRCKSVLCTWLVSLRARATVPISALIA